MNFEFLVFNFELSNMKKIIILTLSGLLIGLIIGCLGTMAYFGHDLAVAMFSLQEVEILEFENSAVDAYDNQPTEVAIWALENFIGMLNRIKKERAPAEVENPYLMLTPDTSLVFSHARLAQLYQKMNNVEKYKYHLEQAVTKGKETHLSALDSEEKLINFIHKLDSSEDDKVNE